MRKPILFVALALIAVYARPSVAEDVGGTSFGSSNQYRAGGTEAGSAASTESSRLFEDLPPLAHDAPATPAPVTTSTRVQTVQGAPGQVQNYVWTK